MKCNPLSSCQKRSSFASVETIWTIFEDSSYFQAIYLGCCFANLHHLRLGLGATLLQCCSTLECPRPKTSKRVNNIIIFFRVLSDPDGSVYPENVLPPPTGFSWKTPYISHLDSSSKLENEGPLSKSTLYANPEFENVEIGET
jgi:hypothetical protein